MLAVVSLLVVLCFSILVTRIATIALVHTGLSRQAARFQARSAFTGAGFTTAESERVVNHPLRRRIVLLLMLLGNAGFVTAISTLILTFVHEGEVGLALKIVLLAAGLAALWSISTSQWVDQRLSHLIERALKQYTRLDIRDYASLMQLAGDYRLVELEVEPQDWIANKTLGAAALRDEGIVVLGIKRQDGTYLGAPTGSTEILPQDILILYGRVSALQELDERRVGQRGDERHEEAVIEQEQVVEEEEKEAT